MLMLKRKIITTFFTMSCFFNIASGEGLPEKDHTVDLESAQGILKTLDIAREAGEAALSIYHLEKSILKFSKTVLINGGEMFRKDSPYKKEFADTAVTNPEEMKFLQSSLIPQLTNELAIVKEDLGLFIDSPAILKSIQDFTSKHRHIVSEIKQVQGFLGDGGHTFLSFFLKHDRISPESLQKITTLLETDYDHVVNSPETEKIRKSYFAALYIVLNIFKNDHSKFSLLFNNRYLVQNIAAFVEEQYGKNPILDFAVKVAPYIAIAENNQVMSRFYNYCFTYTGMIAIGSVGLSYYLLNGKIKNLLNLNKKTVNLKAE